MRSRVAYSFTAHTPYIVHLCQEPLCNAFKEALFLYTLGCFKPEACRIKVTLVFGRRVRQIQMILLNQIFLI